MIGWEVLMNDLIINTMAKPIRMPKTNFPMFFIDFDLV